MKNLFTISALVLLLSACSTGSKHETPVTDSTATVTVDSSSVDSTSAKADTTAKDSIK